MTTKNFSGMQPNSRGDWNWDIHIRDIKKEDFYNGLMVQSMGNSTTIYEIYSVIENGEEKWCYKPMWNIDRRDFGYLKSDLTLLESDKWHYPPRVISDEKWTETFYSIKVNKILQRDKLLEELIQS